MGVAISVIGVLLALIGWIWFLAIAVEENKLWAVLIFFCGWIPALIFILLHLRRIKDMIVPAVLLYGGLAVYSVGAHVGGFWDPQPNDGPLFEVNQPTQRDPDEPAPIEVSDAELEGKETYFEFLLRLKAAKSPGERLDMIQTWREEGFDAADGAYRELVEIVSSGRSSDELEQALLAETERMNPSLEDVVYVLPKVRETVRRGLLHRFRDADEAQRGACKAALATSEDTNHPAILEAYLALGVVTAYRVSRMVRSEGLEWTEDPLLAEALRTRAEEKPAFVEALLKDEQPAVRALGCGYADCLPSEGDAGLKQVLPLLRDETPEVRKAAAVALAQLARPRAAWGLARALARERDSGVRESLIAALDASDAEPTLALIVRLQRKESTEDQLGAALSLQAFPAELVLEPMQLALKSKDLGVVEAAVASLLALAKNGGAEDLAPCRPQVEALQEFTRGRDEALGLLGE